MQRGAERLPLAKCHGKNAYGVINVNHLRATYFSMLETHPRQLASHQSQPRRHFQEHGYANSLALVCRCLNRAETKAAR